MKKTLYSAQSRGKASFGWLESFHSFSFGHYYNPERMQFGALRVLNDDRVAPGMGFDTHPHRNMEIISIGLEGELEHKDSMGNRSVIKPGEVQVMSAGSGVTHSEYNKNDHLPVAFLQIWVIPNRKDVEPRYDQIDLNGLVKSGDWNLFLGPFGEYSGLWIYQNTWFYWGLFSTGQSGAFTPKNPSNGMYIFVVEGRIRIDGEVLDRRDALSLEGIDILNFDILADAKILLMEVPLT